MLSPYSYLAGACLAQAVAASSVLLQGGTIVTWDTETEAVSITRNGSLLIVDDQIAEIAPEGEDCTSEAAADAEVVDVTDKIITPGFIDTHTHRWQTAYRTIGSNTTLWEYFSRYGEFSSAGLYDAEDVYVGQIMGLYEALNAGTTTSLDHAHHTWSNETAEAGLRASIDSGARVFWSYAFRDVEGYTVEEQLVNFRAIAEENLTEGSRTEIGVAYDAFGPEINLEQAEPVMDLAKEFNVSVITTHALGGIWGITNSPSDVHELGMLNTSIPVVFSHAAFLEYNDYELLRETDQYISITPESEMHYGHLHPHSHLAMDQASLGVDTHFTFSIDILTQARIWLQKVRQTLFADTMEGAWEVPTNNPMSVNQAFALATVNGARALRRTDLGVLAPGAQADVVVWDGTSIGMLGFVDPVAAVMLHANVGDIEHVLVGGEFKKRDHKLVVEDFAGLRKRFLTSARGLQQKMADTPLPQPEGKWQSGAELGLAQQADVVRGSSTGY